MILLREVLHSFNSSKYRNWDFCLKLDLSKAFDRMSWSYLEELLPLYGFPGKLCEWIMLCVKSAEFSVVVNGRGDGFLKPRSGLRQGCALSPYLFILGMDALSRGLSSLHQNGLLQGVRLANSAPAITNSLYADNLLLFGKAEIGEASTIVAAMNAFSRMSGQRVGPDKSEIWFSKKTPEGVRREVECILGVSQSSQGARKYLGAPIATSTGAFDFLIEKFLVKLQAWKGRKLTPAGRLVMIKAALQSIPLYYFGTAKIPQGVLHKLTSIIRCFFWGKQVGERYLAYVAWDSITAPTRLGGLGIRDLARMNDSLLMKALWKVGTEEDSLWVKIIKAKYLPRSELWTSKRTYDCTALWRHLMLLRPQLMPMITWKIGDGMNCKVYGQQWFPGALDFIPRPEDRGLRLSDLVQGEQGGWDVERLIQLFGHENCMHIVTNIPPPGQLNGGDELLFHLSTNGKYSVKRAYNEINEAWRRVPANQPQLWQGIWKKGQIQLRVRLFLWKLVSKALPLAKTIALRIGAVSSTCAVCSQEDEDGMHMIFQCHFARACWMSSGFPLRTDNLPSNLVDAIYLVLERSSDAQWAEFAQIVWAIWRCRNARTYQGQQPSLSQFSSFVIAIKAETSLVVKAQGLVGRGTSTGTGQRATGTVSGAANSCYTNASWVHSWAAGLGFVLLTGDRLLAYGVQQSSAACPLQAEAKGLLESVKYVMGTGLAQCTFYTDNATLASAVSLLQLPTEVDWRASREILDLWRLFKCNIGFDCKHISRSHNEMADYLAGIARREGMNYVGFTYPLFKL